MVQEAHTAGHMTSIAWKQRGNLELSLLSGLLFCFVLFTIRPEPQSIGWHHPHSGLLFQPLLNLFGNTLRYSQSCVHVPGDSNSVKLTIKVNNVISRTCSNIKTDFLSFQTINCTSRNILDQCSSC